ncbi:MAG: glucose-1-phosphate adenylyltransferase [Acidobacteria bacterium]|nr:glucose-1-phosphate adenylyltransferase [Acidobacteriota bacterium]
MNEPRILALVLAGGEGRRLAPLTNERSKPAVPFGGRYRLVDFVLSNLYNSGVESVYLLVQYKSQSLIEHVSRAWSMPVSPPQRFVTVAPPQMRSGPEWFQGTADAVHQNLHLIERHAPALVAVFGADHVYRMDLRQMIAAHRACGATVSVAALPVPRARASDFGVIDVDASGRIQGFLEKPAQPPGMPGDASRSYASMGNYLFDTRVLVDALREANARGEHDFGSHVLPRLIRTQPVYAYDFTRNRVPGLRSYEALGYWRDVGTIDAYFAASMDLLGATPRLDLTNPEWPLRSSEYQGPTAHIVGGAIVDSSVGAGTRIRGGLIRQSILRRDVTIEEDVELEQCIVMDHTRIRRGARLRRVIIDRYNCIDPGIELGHGRSCDDPRCHTTPSGIVVIPKGPCTTTGVYPT